MESKCKICGREFNNIHGLLLHLRHSHKLDKKRYYDMFFKKENEGICPVCGKETSFYSLSRGYLKYCSNRCVNNSNEVKNKIIQTCLRKYGSKNPMQSDIVKEKLKQSNLEKYGVISTLELDENKQKARQTCIEKYGVEYPSQNKEIYEKVKNTCLERYGIDNYSKSEQFKTVLNKTTVEHYMQNVSKYGNILEYSNNENYVKFRCNKCNNITISNRLTFMGRALYRNTNPCLICEPLYKRTSTGENELFMFISEHYKGRIIKNDHEVLSNKELDIYLPDLKLAFEYDGTFWHADPRFYNENDIIINNLTAKDMREKDKIKDKICMEHDIKLIRIKEYDWYKNTEIIKENIINILK